MKKNFFIVAYIILFALLVGCALEQPEEYNIEILAGEKYQIDDEIISKYNNIIWAATYDDGAASINNNEIVGNRKGETFFSGYYGDKLVLKFNVTVTEIMLEKIIISDESIKLSVDETYYLPFKLVPENACSQKLDCSLSNKDCIKWELVEGQKISIIGVNPGETILTLKDLNNKKKIAECKVTVEPKIVEPKRVHFDSIDDLREHLSEIEKAYSNYSFYRDKCKEYEATEYHISREVFNEYLEKCETPLILTNDAGGYYDNHKNKNLNRKIQGNGDIVSSKWTYYGDIAKEDRDIEYLDDYYNIKHLQLTKFQLKGNDIDLCNSFRNRVSALRYVDSRFMIINENSVAVDFGRKAIKLLIDD